MRKVDKILVKCAFCNSDILKYPCLIKPNRKYFCNLKHKYKYQIGKSSWSEDVKKRFGESHKGKNNSNYNKRWSTELKKRMSDIVNKRYKERPELRTLVGNSNRGKKRTLEFIKIWHSNRKSPIYTPELRKKMGEASAKKFTVEYKEKMRKIMEEHGNWVPRDKKTAYQIYFIEASWQGRMFEYLSKKDKKLLNQYGVYNRDTNKLGLVRDHKYGRKSGFEHGVFPEILRHPCNCKLITLSENIKKRHNDLYGHGKDNSTSLLKLIRDIKKYTGSWGEHSKCITMINKYKLGERWTRI